MSAIADILTAKVVAELVQAVKDETDLIPELFQALIAEHMESRRLADGERNTGSKLYERTGSLKRAFIRGQRGNIWNRDVSARLTTATIGIDTRELPYAGIHEFGGSIIVPITRKMRGFFWHRFAETGNDMYKRMALTRKTQFTISMPARPFMGPAIEAFEKEELPSIVQAILDRAIAAFNG